MGGGTSALGQDGQGHQCTGAGQAGPPVRWGRTGRATSVLGQAGCVGPLAFKGRAGGATTAIKLSRWGHQRLQAG